MPKSKTEDESCKFCVFCNPSPKREIIVFPDGKQRMFSGLCANPKSPLFEKSLTDNHVAIVNAMHNDLKNYRNIRCFIRKIVAPARP